MSGEYVLSVLLKAQNMAGGQIASFVSSLNPIAGGALAVGGALVGIGVASTKMAADYQQNMNKVQALTGASTQDMKGYDAALKTLAVNAGVAPKALADGLYNVMSAGYKGKDAINVLTLATEDAKIGMTSATVTSDALTNVMASFSVKASDATRVNGEMLETVTLGKATFEQYAQSIVKSASSASQFHVSMETMNAAWSTMTANGIKAAQASTDFQSSLKVMYANIGTVTKSLHSNGIAFDETKFNAMDYGHKVQYLNAALQQANDKHVKVTGATLQASQAISTIAQHIDTYNSNLKSLSDKQAMAKKTQEAWAVTQGGFNQTMDRLNATVQVVMISIGQKLLPVVTKLAAQIIPIVQRIGDWLIKSGALDTVARVLTNGIQGIVTIIGKMVSTGSGVVSFFQHNQTAMDALKSVLVGIGVAISLFAITQIPVMLGALGAWAAAQWLVVAPVLATALPFILIGLLVAAVVFGIIMVVRNWGAISKWLQQAWNTSLKAIGGFFSWLGTHVHQILNAIGAAIGGFFSAVGSKVHAGLDAITGFFKAAWAWVLNAAKIAFIALILIIIGPIGDLIVLIVTHWTQIKAFLSDAWNKISSLAKDTWNNMVHNVETFVLNLVVRFIQLKTNVITHVQMLISKIRTFFTNLPGQALQWGQNLIQGFINGIKNMIGAVGNVASNVVNTVKNFLGFHSPAKTGPGSDADQWAPNLMKMYVKGIQGGMAGIKVAVKNAAALMKAGFTGDANQLNQKINTAQYQLYLDQKAAATAAYNKREATAHEKFLAEQHKRYEKYLASRQKALDKYNSEKHHKKAFSYHAFKPGTFKPLKETLPKFTGLALGAFANQTNILDPSMGNGAPMALPASQTSNNKPVIHVDNSVNLVVHGSVVNHAQLLKDLQKQQDKNHRMQGTHVAVTSGGRAK